MQFDFLAIMVVVLKFIVVLLLLVVLGSEVYLPMLPSWPEVDR